MDDGSISHCLIPEALLLEFVMEMCLREAVANELKYSSEVSAGGKKKTQGPCQI
jgi:hypothetical protein